MIDAFEDERPPTRFPDSLCEWNPVHNTWAISPSEPGDCQNLAEVSVGPHVGETWHVCTTCAELQPFKGKARRQLYTRPAATTDPHLS